MLHPSVNLYLCIWNLK